jgi:hypothetical protein
MNTVVDYPQFCAAWLDSWSGNRPDTLLGFYTEDAFYLDPANPAGLEGHAQMKKYFEKLLSRNPDWQWAAEEIFPTEKGFTLKWKALIPVKEQSFSISGLDIVEMSANKISRNEVYFDRAPWMELLKK